MITEAIVYGANVLMSDVETDTHSLTSKASLTVALDHVFHSWKTLSALHLV